MAAVRAVPLVLLLLLLASCVTREAAPPRPTTTATTTTTQPTPTNPVKDVPVIHREVASDAYKAFADFELSCPAWLDTGDSPDVMVKLNCANLWEWLPHTWTALEAAVVQ